MALDVTDLHLDLLEDSCLLRVFLVRFLLVFESRCDGGSQVVHGLTYVLDGNRTDWIRLVNA